MDTMKMLLTVYQSAIICRYLPVRTLLGSGVVGEISVARQLREFDGIYAPL